ncbi:formate dehydrogenase accessory protein FdhE [Piscinibacter sakaiensis]|nr:formate dehydrogenase accessory protein FdhE [Piscinibacter sakaiensis]
MSPEEIAARAGGEVPFLRGPASGAFAERQMRLRQLAAGHPMADFLGFIAEVARAQQARLAAFPPVPVPDAAALERAGASGRPALSAVDWPRDPAWRDAARALAADLAGSAPAPARAVLARLAEAGDDWLEAQADCLLTGVMRGLDLATAPLVAAALQVYWTHLVSEVQRLHGGGATQAFGRPDDPTGCPCCGSGPTASVTRSQGGALGQRYLHCALCGTEWHLPRAKCSHCQSTRAIAYHSLDAAGSDEDGSARAAQATIQAESCEDCGHYLKIVHTDRDPFVDPVADDLATVTLDLLVSEQGLRRHGVNLMLLYGEPDPDGAPPPGGS